MLQRRSFLSVIFIYTRKMLTSTWLTVYNWLCFRNIAYMLLSRTLSCEDFNGTCEARSFSQCFAAVEEVFNPETGSLEPEYTYGCLPPEEKGLMQVCYHYLTLILLFFSYSVQLIQSFFYLIISVKDIWFLTCFPNQSLVVTTQISAINFCHLCTKSKAQHLIQI